MVVNIYFELHCRHSEINKFKTISSHGNMSVEKNSSKYIDLFIIYLLLQYYCQVSNISCTLVSNKIVDHSDVVGASPVGAAPTTSSFST